MVTLNRETYGIGAQLQKTSRLGNVHWSLWLWWLCVANQQGLAGPMAPGKPLDPMSLGYW